MTNADQPLPSFDLPDEDADPFVSLRHGGTEIYLVRHGDALPDAAEVVLDGVYASQPLSALGRAQAHALADRLLEVAPVAVFASPIVRARQTAALVADALGLTISIEHDLREIEVSNAATDVPAGTTPDDVAGVLRRRLTWIGSRALTVGYWSAIPGSESSGSLRARARDALQRIAAGYPGERVVVVSHGGLINAYVADLLGIQRDYFFPCANTAISVVRVHGERRLLLLLNDVGHLRHAGLMQ